MTDLAAWLLEQIAADEQAALAASPGPWFVPAPNGLWPKGPIVCENHWPGLTEEEAEEYGEAPGPPHYVICQALHGGTRDADAAHIARWDPARVLAECEAKRRLVEWATRYVDSGGESFNDGLSVAAGEALRLLAQLYADRPGFREEWRLAAVSS